MRILIVEDERPTAEDIQLIVGQILGNKIASIHIETTLANAEAYLQEKTIDVLLLDLNLNAKDGFVILKQVLSKSFHTIVISANTDRAIEAFEYGVLDFIPKPYNSNRLRKAFDRLASTHASDGHAIQYLSVKRGYKIEVVPLRDVCFFKSSNIYVELHLNDGKVEIYDKSMKKLNTLLPPQYYRIHKSYTVNIELIEKILVLGGGQYRAVLTCGDCLPVSRSKIDHLKKLLNI